MVFLDRQFEIIHLLVEDALVHMRQKEEGLVEFVLKAFYQAFEYLQGLLELALL